MQPDTHLHVLTVSSKVAFGVGVIARVLFFNLRKQGHLWGEAEHLCFREAGQEVPGAVMLRALSYFQRLKVAFLPPNRVAQGCREGFMFPEGLAGGAGQGAMALCCRPCLSVGCAHGEHTAAQPASRLPDELEPLQVLYLMTSVGVCAALSRPAGCLSHVQTCCLAQKGVRALTCQGLGWLHFLLSSQRPRPGSALHTPEDKALVGWVQARDSLWATVLGRQ